MQADSIFCIDIEHATEEAANTNKDYFNLQLEVRVSSVPLQDELIILREMNTILHCLVKALNGTFIQKQQTKIWHDFCHI